MEPRHRSVSSFIGHARRPLSLFAVLFVALTATPTVAQLNPTTQVTGYLTIGTDSRNRGLSQVLDDDFAAAIGIDIDFPSTAFAGAAISNVSYPGGLRWPDPPQNLVKLYAGYGWDSTDWNVGASLGHYRYGDTAFDYDYTEVTLAIGYRDRLFYDIYASLLEANWRVRKAHNIKLSYDFVDPSDGTTEDERERYSLLWEYTPVQLIQTRLGYRTYNGVPEDPFSNRDQLFAELHVYF